MVPIITNLTNSLELSNNWYEENLDNEAIDDKEILTNQQINYNNIREVLENVKKKIYIGLKHYWAISNKFGIMAALLDSQYKNLDFISDNDIKRRIYATLKTQYDQLKCE